MAELRQSASARRVLVIASEHVAERMAGPAIRSLNLARQLAAQGCRVTLATPGSDGSFLAGEPGIDHVSFGTPSMRGFRALAASHDVVVSQPQRVDVAHGLARSGAAIIYDLYVPSFVERIAQLGGEAGDSSLHARLLNRDQREYAAALELGDAFICASERQRDHWLGALGQAGRLDIDLLERDANADLLCGIVPFGIDADPPALDQDANRGALRGTLVPEDSIVLLWTGGLWNWFDPVTVVEALARARRLDPRLRLVLMGMRHPEAAWQEQDASRQMRVRAEQLGLLEDGGVVLCEQWAPYERRHTFLLDADIAVSAHHDTLETRLSFRTRFLDHLWAGLPTITTQGGELTDRMAAIGAARTVADGDVDGWTDALLELAEDLALRRSMGAAARELAQEYRWERATEPLTRIVGSLPLDASNRRPRRVRRRFAALRYAALLIRIRVQAKGLRSLGGAVRGAAGRNTG